MTIPAAYTTALAQAGVSVDLWIEIEGLPYGYGWTARTASFFSGRASNWTRLGIRSTLVGVPAGVEQELSILDATSSIGQLTALILDDDAQSTGIDADSKGGRTALELIAGVGRTSINTDNLLPMSVSQAWAANTAYVSGTAGSIVRPTSADATAWFECTTSGTSHATTEPTWDTVIGNTTSDGTAVWTCRGTIDLEYDASPNYIPYAGTASASNYPTGGGYIYLGRETILYTSRVASSSSGGGYFTGITRWKFNLDEGIQKDPHTAGDLISYFPRFLVSRRANLYATLDGTDANKLGRWAGVIRGSKWNEGLCAIEISLESIESELKVELFKTQRRARLKTGIYGKVVSDYKPDTEKNESKPLNGAVLLDERSIEGQTWTNGEYLYCRIGDEYFLGLISGTSPDSGGRAAQVKLILHSTDYGFGGGDAVRGLFGTERVEHRPGAELKEVIVVCRQTSSGALSKTGFTLGDHPFDVARCLLASTGDVGVNGGWDTLKKGHGLGLDNSRIDHAGIDSLKSIWVQLARHVEIIEDKFVLKEKLAEILKPFCCYPVQLLNNKLTIKRMNPPTPLNSPVAITTSSIVQIGSWDSSIGDVIGEVIFRYDYDPVEGRFEATATKHVNGPGTEAKEFYANTYKTHTIESHGQRSSVATFNIDFGTQADDVAQDFTDTIADRYGKPGPILDVVCDYSFHSSVEVGDLVSITETNIPNVKTGARGVTSTDYFEVLRKSIDDIGGTVTLTVQHTYYSDQFRLVAPSATVASYGSPAITCNEHDFSASTDSVDASAFAVGDTIQVRTPNLFTLRGTGTIQSIAGSVITLTAGIAGTAAGDILTCRSYDSAIASRRARSAFMAGDAQPPTVGASAQAQPHLYAS